MRDAIRDTQWHSEALTLSEALRGNQEERMRRLEHSGALRGYQRPSKATEGNQEERVRRLEHLFRRVKRLRARKIGARCAEARRVARVVPVYNQRSSEVIGGHQWQSEVISVVQGPSVVISGHQWQSGAIRRRTGDATCPHQTSRMSNSYAHGPTRSTCQGRERPPGSIRFNQIQSDSIRWHFAITHRLNPEHEAAGAASSAVSQNSPSCGEVRALW